MSDLERRALARSVKADPSDEVARERLKAALARSGQDRMAPETWEDLKAACERAGVNLHVTDVVEHAFEGKAGPLSPRFILVPKKWLPLGASELAPASPIVSPQGLALAPEPGQGSQP